MMAWFGRGWFGIAVGPSKPQSDGIWVANGQDEDISFHPLAAGGDAKFRDDGVAQRVGRALAKVADKVVFVLRERRGHFRPKVKLIDIHPIGRVISALDYSLWRYLDSHATAIRGQDKMPIAFGVEFCGQNRELWARICKSALSRILDLPGIVRGHCDFYYSNGGTEDTEGGHTRHNGCFQFCPGHKFQGSFEEGCS